MQHIIKFLLGIHLLLISASLSAQKSQQAYRDAFRPVCDSIEAYFGERVWHKNSLTVNKCQVKDEHMDIHFSNYLLNRPLRKEDVNTIQNILKQHFPEKYRKYSKDFSIFVNNRRIEQYISGYYSRIRRDEIIANNNFPRAEQPLVSRKSLPHSPTNGLNGRHIGLWQSHGLYYNRNEERWMWQRPRFFGTVEDLNSLDYVLTYIVPMLENAGANVMLPKERDFQANEVIVDNDSSTAGRYSEKNGKYKWEGKKQTGFAIPDGPLAYGQNPFTAGSSRVVRCVTDTKNESLARWTPDIPENGEYAVYVSYTSQKNSCKAARYEVRHKGGVSRFTVNQSIGGGTWIYLGTFGFDNDNKEQGVVLSNLSGDDKEYVCADAVRFGGGMGNVDTGGGVSGFPRYAEGARYWTQWAGMPTKVYANADRDDDYKNDIRARPLWINHLAGGSSRNPGAEGLGIPLDLSFALHTDDYLRGSDLISGTLAIYTTVTEGKSTFPAGGSRMANRELCDIVQTQVVDDIRALYAPGWGRRYLWDQSYFESRLPIVPSMLLELLSHNYIVDQRYGLEPVFKFTVSRAIYKGILKFLCYINNDKCVVQPLPVQAFAADMLPGNKVRLSWSPTEDPLEPSASPDSYIIYTRVTSPDDVEDLPLGGIYGFDNGVLVKDTTTTVSIKPGLIYSFKVVAANSGGNSFPSEILSVGTPDKGSPDGNILVINAFDRVSAPASFTEGNFAGFLSNVDAGVPYIRSNSCTGAMYQFDRRAPYENVDMPGFGASFSNLEGKMVAGNTFDFPLIHGAAIMKAGYSFASAGSKAVERGSIRPDGYAGIDIIAGKQKLITIGGDYADSIPHTQMFALYTPELMSAVRAYCEKGGKVIISGENIAKEARDKEQKAFIADVLKFSLFSPGGSASNRLEGFSEDFSYHHEMNCSRYCISLPDALKPTDKLCTRIMSYNDSRMTAGLLYKGDTWRVASFGFPIECLESQSQIDLLIEEVLGDLFE